VVKRRGDSIHHVLPGGHDHDHGPPSGASDRRRLALVLAITTVALIVEVVGAAVSGSLALLADAGHALTDAAGLTLALGAAFLAQRPATPQRTWGYRRAEVLAAAAQAAVLLAAGVFVLVEGVRRLLDPPEVASAAMLVFGVVGLVGNMAAIGVLASSRTKNLNMRAAFLEVVNDALGSVAVLVAAVCIAVFGWQRADAVASLLIGALILPRTWRLLRETVDVLLEATPKGLDLDGVRAHILDLPHVLDVHDLHASQVASNLPVLSAHVVVDDGCFHDGHAPQILDQLQQCVASHHGVSVEHSTFQLEAAGHGDHEHPTHA
jgi:cobalt-zinc-cadmium efflux system protein